MGWVEKHGIQVSTQTYSLAETNQALLDLKLSNINGEAVISFEPFGVLIGEILQKN
jgi:D-arabinose 1-dehydrogenase-like Zn-dependent alcohol dehydrogenase